jgi:uncharacterized protein YxjI
VSDHAPNWYPDPFGRHELRYWDGTTWTEHVASHGRQSVDAPVGEPKSVLGGQSADKVQRQVERANLTEAKRGATVGAGFAGDGTIFGESVLVVNQKAKLIEINNEYAIYDRDGRQLGAIRQVGQSTAKKVLRVVASVDQFLTHKLQVVDMAGNILLSVTRPAKVVKSRVLIADGAGRDIGEIVQENVFGKIRFGFVAGGQQIGGIYAENWRAWNFSIKDSSDTEVARITKTFEGVAKTLFTTADNYVLQIHRPLVDPLRQLVVASALTIDTALKQDSRGFG